MSRVSQIKFLISEYFDGVQKNFADAIGKKPTQVSHWITGVKPVGDAVASQIETALDLPRGWLDGKQSIDGFPKVFSDDLPNNRVRLDLYDVAASFGGGHLIADYPEFLHSLEIPNTALKELLGTDNLHGVKLISPDGDSMEPTVPAKSVALIRTDVSDFAAGGVYLFTFQGYTYIKRLSRGKAGVIHVTSDNPIYGKSDFVIEPEEFDDLFIHGKFWKVLPLDFLDI